MNPIAGTPARLVCFILATFSGTASANPPQPLGCLIEPFRITDVGSQIIGVIESLDVERGDVVRKGQVIAELRSDVERAAVAIASSRVESNAEIQAATAAKVLADQKLKRTRELVAQEFLSKQALDQAQSEADVAHQRLAQAREQKRIWQRELQLAQAQLELRRIRSPSDGVIAERYLSPGERVEEKPIVRVATIDPLRVEVVLPAALFGSVRVDDTLMVTPDTPNSVPRLGKIVLVDRLVDGPSNTFRVRLALSNPGGELPAGVRCTVDLGLEQLRSSPSAPAGVPAMRRGIEDRKAF
jgi:RND family efflux transporter MFP subunit